MTARHSPPSAGTLQVWWMGKHSYMPHRPLVFDMDLEALGVEYDSREKWLHAPSPLAPGDEYVGFVSGIVIIQRQDKVCFSVGTVLLSTDCWSLP